MLLDKHLKASKCILRCIKGAISESILFSKCQKLQVKIFNVTSHHFSKTFVNSSNDGDWASDPDTHRSYFRSYFYLGTNMIYCFSKRQTTISHSST